MLLKSLQRDQRGFTLIELMTVVAIIAVLAGIGIPVYRNFITRAQQAQVLTAADPVRQALATYYAENGSYPDSSNATANTKLADAIKTYMGAVELGTDLGIDITNTRVVLGVPKDENTVWTTLPSGATSAAEIKGYIAYTSTDADGDPVDGGTAAYIVALYVYDGANLPGAGATAATATPFKCYNTSGPVTCPASTELQPA